MTLRVCQQVAPAPADGAVTWSLSSSNGMMNGSSQTTVRRISELRNGMSGGRPAKDYHPRCCLPHRHPLLANRNESTPCARHRSYLLHGRPIHSSTTSPLIVRRFAMTHWFGGRYLSFRRLSRHRQDACCNAVLGYKERGSHFVHNRMYNV